VPADCRASAWFSSAGRGGIGPVGLGVASTVGGSLPQCGVMAVAGVGDAGVLRAARAIAVSTMLWGR
jgi:hypothetical protein